MDAQKTLFLKLCKSDSGNRVFVVGKQAGAVTVPISLATTFKQVSPGVPGEGGYMYRYRFVCITVLSFLVLFVNLRLCSRSSNPTRESFEKCIATLEKARYGLAFASGCAAVATLVNMLKSGDHVICIDDVYGGTGRYFRRVAMPSNNISFTFVDFTVDGALEAAFLDNTKV